MVNDRSGPDFTDSEVQTQTCLERTGSVCLRGDIPERRIGVDIQIGIVWSRMVEYVGCIDADLQRLRFFYLERLTRGGIEVQDPGFATVLRPRLPLRPGSGFCRRISPGLPLARVI
jgi:hypothetical protein